MSTKSVSRYKQLLTTQVDNLHEVSHFNRKRLVLWTTPKTLEPQWIKGIAKKSHEYEVGYTQEKSNCPVSNTFMPLSALSTMSRSPIGANSDWIHQLNSKNNGPVFFFYLRLYFGTDNVSRRLWQWIETNRLDIQSTRYQSIQDQDIQQPDTYKTESVQIMKVPKKVTLK